MKTTAKIKPKTKREKAGSPAVTGSAPASLNQIATCLDHGRMAWKIWAEHWRTNPAYGNGQPRIHETHARLIADFDAAIATVEKLSVQSVDVSDKREREDSR